MLIRTLLAMAVLAAYMLAVVTLVAPFGASDKEFAMTLFIPTAVGFVAFAMFLNHMNRHLTCPFCGLKEAKLEKAPQESESESAFEVEVYGPLDDSAAPMYLRCRACHAYARTDTIMARRHGKQSFRRDESFP